MCLFFVTFDLHLWPLGSVKIISPLSLDVPYVVFLYISTSSLVFYKFWGKFDLDLWPWPEVKVIVTWVIQCALLGCTLVPSMKCVGEIASELWQVLWFFTHFFGKLRQGHRHLGHWMCLIGLYLGTKYEVYRWNSIRDMASSLVLYHFGGNLTFDLDLRSRSSALGSFNAPYWAVPWYQVWSL